MKNLMLFMAFAVASFVGSQCAFGQSGKTQPATATSQHDPGAPDEHLHVDVSPYLWFAGLHGDVGAPNHQASVHASAIDLLSDFRFGIMVETDLRYKRVIAPIDLMWLRLGDDQTLAIGFGDTSANVRIGEIIFTPKLGYRVVDREKFKIDALTGFRFWHMHQKLEFSPNRFGLNFSASQNWMDPLVGGRIAAAVSPKVELTIAGDVGGWGAGSQLDYQMFGALGYRFKPKWVLQAGYRYMSVDFRNSTTVFDVVMSGIVVGVTISLK